jgi:TIR domain/AAA ATPase domain
MSDTSTQDRVIIFESYGWRDAADVAKRLKTSLERAGFEVWIDRAHIRPDAVDFWSPLQQALEKCKLIVALLSPHSIRRESEISVANGVSVCHNELVMAVRMNKTVVSVTVVECEPPLAINLYEPIDFTRWNRSSAAYDQGVEEILYWVREGLADRRRYCIFVDNLSRDRLTFPEEQIAELDFVGRDWLLHEVDEWYAGDRKCLLIEAEPGSGKTAFVAELLRRNPGDRIVAYHFCNSRRADTINPRRFVRSLSAMLCGTVPAYRTLLRGSEDIIRSLKSEGQPATMLWDGILSPLRRLSSKSARYAVIDALDEAVSTSAATSIPQLMAEAIDEFPSWLKLIVTTRPHDRILPIFQFARRCHLGESVGAQREDVRRYIAKRVAEPKLSAVVGLDATARSRTISTIVEQSGGNFKYAEMVLDELGHGALLLDELGRLPNSLAGLYYNRAEARFPDGKGFAEAHTVLAVLMAAKLPLTRTQLAMITRLDRDDTLLRLLRILNCFVTWDPDVGDGGLYRIAHKSIGDWLIAPRGGFDRFRVDAAVGREMILAHCRRWAEHHELYAVTYFIVHLLEAGLRKEALEAIHAGLFDKRRPFVDLHRDFEDTRGLTLALIAARDETAIVGLAKTENVGQRDGVAAGLQAAPANAEGFVEGVVKALLQVS